MSLMSFKCAVCDDPLYYIVLSLFGKFYFCTDLITHMHQFNAYYGECTKFGRKKGNQSYNQIIRFCYFRNLATSQGLMQSKAACRTCTAIQGAWHPACERQSRMRDLFSRCPMAERLPLFSYFRNSPEEQYKSQKSCAHIIKLHCCRCDLRPDFSEHS